MRLTKKFLSLSLLIHAALLIMLSMAVRPKIVHTASSPELLTINSLLIVSQHHTVATPSRSTSGSIRQTMPLQPATAAASASSPASRSTPTSHLLALLHAAIEREQRYPASAQEQEREGRTTLAFTLLPDGSIRGINIIHTSGTTSLDHAALAAVNAAAPFTAAREYLQSPQNFQLDVVFKLT